MHYFKEKDELPRAPSHRWMRCWDTSELQDTFPGTILRTSVPRLQLWVLMQTASSGNIGCGPDGGELKVLRVDGDGYIGLEFMVPPGDLDAKCYMMPLTEDEWKRINDNL